MTKFTAQLRYAAKDLWEKSMQQPFVKELQSGKLPLATFRFYLLQDRYYLAEFSKIHRLMAKKTASQEVQQFLLAGARDLQECEITLQQHFFTELKVTPVEIEKTDAVPTAYAYVNHLYKTLEKDGIAPCVCAILPCYWLYQEIGQALAQNGSPVALYQKWIDTYDSDWYDVNVSRMLKLTNDLAKQASELERRQMQQAFVRSIYYECRFWQMAYEQEQWQQFFCHKELF